jgi:hypothetical protein
MSAKELRRVEVLSRVKEGDLRLVDAADWMGVSYRQGKRLWKRYREEGAAGLQHRSAGGRSNRGSATIGWCATRGAFCRSSGRAGMRRRGGKVLVSEGRDGQLQVLYRGRPVRTGGI